MKRPVPTARTPVETHKEGEKFKVKANPCTYEGYTFTAWNDGTKDVAAESEYTMPAKNVTFTAKWEKKADQVTVTYALGEYTEGAVPTPTKVTKGAEFTLPAGPTWEGHLFTGWKLGEEVKKAGEKITVSENITLTAQWVAVSLQFTEASLEKDETAERVYIVVNGVYEGYPADELQALFEDADYNQFKMSICLGSSPYTQQEFESTVTVNANGTINAKLDVTELEWDTPFFVLQDQSGSGDLKSITSCEEELVFGGVKYRLTGSTGQVLTIVLSDASKMHEYTGMALEATADKVYLTVSGTFSGYTDDEFKGLLEDDNKDVLGVSLTTPVAVGDWNKWAWLDELETTVTVSQGTFAVKIDVTSLPAATTGNAFYICENQSGSGDITWNQEAFSSTVTFGDKKFIVERNPYGKSQLKVETYVEVPEDATYAVTALTIEKQENAVYLVYKGTYANYEQELLAATLKKALCLDVHKIGGATSTGTAGDGWTLTMSDGQWQMELNITVGNAELFTSGTYFIDSLNDYTESSKPLFALWPTDVVVELGEYTYKTSAPVGEKKEDPIYTWGNVVFIIEQKATEPVYTFSEPTSVTLEVSKSDGREDGKLFREEVDAAFIVFSGTYTGEVTEEIAKDYFSAAKYVFKFIAKEQKDRLRRISIDTEAKTWTLKFDITPLPAVDNKCVLKDADLKLAIPADATKEVKALGSTYTIKNDADGVLIVNVVHNYKITGIDLELSEEKVPYLVMKGSFEKEKFTAEEIKKFLEDDDVRTLCLNLLTYVWPMNDYYKVNVTTTEDTFTVKLDISRLSLRENDKVLSEASGYGDIVMEGINKEITNGIKKFTLKTGEGNVVMLTVAMAEGVTQEMNVTTAAIAEDGGKIYITLTGTYKGYTADEFKALLEDKDTSNLAFRVFRFGGPQGNDWSTQDVPPVYTVEAGTFTVKFDVTNLGTETFGVGKDWGAYGDIKTTNVNQTAVLGTKNYTLNGTAENLTFVIVDTAKETVLTEISLIENESRIYLVYTGTYKNYTVEELKAYLEDEGTFTFWGNGSAGSQKPTSRAATVSDGTWTLKFDVTDMPYDDEYALCWKDYVGSDLKPPKEDATDIELKVGFKKFTLIAKAWNGTTRLTIKPCTVDIGSDKHDNDFDPNPEYTDSIKKGQVLSFKGKFTSLGTQNYFAPVLFLYTAGTTPAISFRIDWWVNELSLPNDNPDTKVCDTEKWTVTKYEGPVWDKFTDTIKDAEVILTINWSRNDVIFVSFLAKGTETNLVKRMVYTVVASEGALEDSYAVGIGTDHCHLVLDERSVGKAGYNLYDELKAETQLNLGAENNTTVDHYLFNNYIKKGDKIVFEGTSKAGLATNWDANGLYIGTEVGTQVWFRADNFVDGTTYTDQTPVHDVTVESWHIEKDNKGWDDWAKYKEILANCTYKLTIDWTGDAIVITMEFTAEAGTYTQTYTVTALEGATLSTQYNFGLGCCNSSASLKATTVTRA